MDRADEMICSSDSEMGAAMIGQQQLGMLTLALLALGCLYAPATADGPPRSVRPDYYPAVAPGQLVDYNWTGIYGGGQAGVAYSKVEWSYTGTLDNIEQSHVGFAGGAFVGLQKQWGRAVIGAEVSYVWGAHEETSGSALVADTSLSSNVKNLLLATGKIGYAWQNALAYAKGGYATAEVEFRTSVTSTGVVTTTSSGREHGWTAGIGIEYAIRPHIILGVEYDYVHLNVDDRDQIPTPAGVAGTRVTGADIDIQMVMARLSFKFGPRAEPVPFK
jgi:outer membrane immunogenic protein